MRFAFSPDGEHEFDMCESQCSSLLRGRTCQAPLMGLHFATFFRLLTFSRKTWWLPRQPLGKNKGKRYGLRFGFRTPGKISNCWKIKGNWLAEPASPLAVRKQG